MGFYEQISKYYDYIFPTGKEQLNFLKEVAGNPPKTILDIACGTGGYSLEFCKQGYTVTSSDLDIKMLEMLEVKAKSENYSLDVIQSDMLYLNEKLTKKYNLVFCIGNSIVHLNSLQQIREFIIKAKQLLDKDGSLVLQIINFDRILLRDIKELPTLENKDVGLTFERKYEYDKQRNKIYFKTSLSVENQLLDNEVELYPLLQDELIDIIENAGFKKYKLFGDFNGNEYDKYNSFMLVLWAR